MKKLVALIILIGTLTSFSFGQSTNDSTSIITGKTKSFKIVNKSEANLNILMLKKQWNKQLLRKQILLAINDSIEFLINPCFINSNGTCYTQITFMDATAAKNSTAVSTVVARLIPIGTLKITRQYLASLPKYVPHSKKPTTEEQNKAVKSE